MSFFSILVAHAAAFDINTSIPGPVDISKYGILAYIQNGYLLALGAAGALAIGSIIYGAVQYTVSRGNPSKLSDAWDRIIQALLGILLLVGAGTILSIVNPGLLSLELPRILPVASTGFQADPFGGIEEAPAPDGTPINIAKTVSCKIEKTKCTSLKAAGFTCKAGHGDCTANVEFVAILSCAAQKVGLRKADIRITEAYPPTVPHKDHRHTNGCSVDTTLPESYLRGGCPALNSYLNAITSCGGSALNEYLGVMYGIDFSKCGSNPSTRTGNNVHVNACPRGTL